MSEKAVFSFATVIEDAKKIITDPAGFYKSMSKTGGYGEPLIFAIVMAVITGLIIALYGMLSFSSFNAITGGAVGFAAIIVMPIMAVLGCFIGGAIMYVIWKLAGSGENYEVAVRCVAYTFVIMPAIALVSFIPYLAGAAKTLWSMFLLYTASIEVHKLKQEITKIVFGVLAAIFVLWGVSAEHTARNISAKLEKMTKGSLQGLENMGEMSPEEAGKAFGEFMKGLEDAQKAAEKAAQE